MVVPVERNKSFIHTGLSRGEVVGGIFWLSLGALISLLLEVVYLGTWITLPGNTQIAFPYTIVLAFLFNMVLTRTSMLWTDIRSVAGIPLFTWVLGFAFILVWSVAVGDQLVGSNIRSVLLLFAGIAGGIWPLVKGK
ncbi:hypothetical protein [uncultured Corynebacterium sp.]|uniref:hypothetical protein n=1 Tax=uncultured Corynebacterium sp. TaxID=159447 RepID=UPI0025FC0E29|nr:hypothetical protein [uncultured Corynebacterium sp.]